MAAQSGLLKGLDYRDTFLCIRFPKAQLLTGISAALLISSLFAGLPARADEFNPLAIYKEAQPLNDRWQACVAAFAKPRLQSRIAPEVLAENALEACRPAERRLLRFFVDRIGKRSAENLIAALREKYRSDLSTIIRERRTPE